MRLQEAKRQLKNHLLSEVADEVNARREEKQESEEQGSARVFAHFGLRPSPWR